MVWQKFQSVFWVLVILLDTYTVVRAVTRGHGVETTLAWLFAILAFPGLGAGAYLLLANPSVRRTARRKRMSAELIRAAVRRVGHGLDEAAQRSFTAHERSLLYLASSVTELSPTAGNAVEILTKTDTAFEKMETAVSQARKSIWAEFYIIRNDETGYIFLDFLAEKARAGVEVKLLYDAFGSLGLDMAKVRAIRAAGGRAEDFLPLNPLRRRWAIHLRNHRKTVIVDGEVGFTGGMNMSDEYSGRIRRRGGQFFRDTHLMLRGPAVGDLAQIFAEDWSFATGEELMPTPAPPAVPGATSIVSVLPSGPDQEHNASHLVYFAGIACARERCFVASPYFIPDSATVQAMVSAALRGVDVRLIVPEKCDIAMVKPAARFYFPQLIRAGVRVFEYQPAMLHSKTMVVDGTWGVVGSANVDVRSFRLNFEVGALVLNGHFGEELERRYLGWQEESREVTEEDLARRGPTDRFREGVARLLGPLL